MQATTAARKRQCWKKCATPLSAMCGCRTSSLALACENFGRTSAPRLPQVIALFDDLVGADKERD